MILPIFVAIVLVLIAYLLGSIPTGYLLGKYLKGIDIRQEGSGSTGATNVLRTLGKKAGITVLLIDVCKGAIALYLVNLSYQLEIGNLPENWQSWLIIGAGIAALLGHSKSIFLNFTGGKSVATSLGILLMLNPVVALGTLTTFGVVLAISRIVSLSSICGAIAVNGLMFAFNQPLAYQIFAILAGIYVIYRHKTNIERILAGTEPKIGQKLEQNS
jgi:acyl phosphate:glycerol-3-phosphate acyltransferase